MDDQLYTDQTVHVGIYIFIFMFSMDGLEFYLTKTIMGLTSGYMIDVGVHYVLESALCIQHTVCLATPKHGLCPPINLKVSLKYSSFRHNIVFHR